MSGAVLLDHGLMSYRYAPMMNVKLKFTISNMA